MTANQRSNDLIHRNSSVITANDDSILIIFFASLHSKVRRVEHLIRAPLITTNCSLRNPNLSRISSYRKNMENLVFTSSVQHRYLLFY